MPQHKSAIKRIRQSARRRIRNKADLSRMKTLVKNVRSAKEKAVGEKALKIVVKFLDRIGTKGVIHRNKASNLKSKLTKYVNTLK